MPQGGFGNLIALPLQKGPRERGHSVFLDERFVPWADQWAFLARIRKVGRSQVEHLVQEAEGAFILRVLAEDVGRELDLVLDAVLRTLSRRLKP